MHGTSGGPSLLAPAEGSCQQCAILDSSPPCLDRSHDESADHAPPRGHQSRDEFQSGREGRRRDRPCGTGAYAPPGTATYVRYPGVTHGGSAVDADRPAQSRSRSSPDSGLVPPTPKPESASARKKRMAISVRNTKKVILTEIVMQPHDVRRPVDGQPEPDKQDVRFEVVSTMDGWNTISK